ncbi:unnamed protein product [Urochloa humidicola]
MEDATERPPAAYLPDDLIVKILSCLPAKSLCRFMCVSKSWHALVSDPDLLLAPRPCFFFWRYHDDVVSPGFITAEGEGDLPLVDPALSFLPASICDEITLLDSCNGLLLLRCSPAVGSTVPPRPDFYAVCNPATEEWAALPQPSLAPGFDSFYTKACTAALGFDPSVSSHFHVFQIEEKEQMYEHFVNAVEIYSSETGTWERKVARWAAHHRWLFMTGHKTYFNGFLHLTIWNHGVIATTDTKGQTWRTIAVPSNGKQRSGFVSHSQGHLIYVDVRTQVAALAIYVLEDHSRDRWTLRHKVSADLIGLRELPSWSGGNPVVAFHPTCDVFFSYDEKGKRLMSYDMKAKRVHVIRVLEDVVDVDVEEIYLIFLYVPSLYSGTLDGPDVN